MEKEKFELLKSIVESTYQQYPLHKDIPVDERRLANELEIEGYLTEKNRHCLVPTNKGLKLIKNT